MTLDGWPSTVGRGVSLHQAVQHRLIGALSLVAERAVCGLA